MNICEYCNQQFQAKNSWNKNRFCSKPCRVDRQKEVLKQFNKSRVGKTYEQIYGQEIGKQTSQKIAKATREYSLKQGRIPPSRKGVKDTIETRKKKSETWRKKLQSNDLLRKQRLSFLLKNITSLEQEMIDLIERYNLPFKYTGDGSFWLAGKNPDFVHIDGEKVAIEVGNIYHHQNGYVENRTKFYQEQGWDSYIFIGQHINEDQVLKGIQKWRFK